MVTSKRYDNEKLIEECFYDSSNVVYSKLLDNKDALKTLFVVFSSGDQYRYDDVSVTAYLSFREEESTGKGLNKYIACRLNGKPKYKYEKVGKVNLEELKLLREALEPKEEIAEQETDAQTEV